VDKLKVPGPRAFRGGYVELLRKHAFEMWNPGASDDTPPPMTTRRSLPQLGRLRAFKHIGALLLMASKPDRHPGTGYTIY